MVSKMTYSHKNEEDIADWEDTTLSNPNSSPATPTSPVPPKIPSTSAELPENWKDVQDDLRQPVPGWPKVAMQMADTPDFAAFSRFRALNIKSLLYYQTEITLLEKRLHKKEWKDNRSGVGKAPRYAKHADLLVDALDGDVPQWKLMKKLRLLLKEYSKSMGSIEE
jgi:hypothetical protein